MYSNIQSAVRVGCVLSDWFSVNAGVRQGDNLAPSLFAIYVNDLVSDINSLNRGVPIGNTSVSCLIYADDIVLISDSCEHLQDQLNSVYAWCNKWRLQVNMSKTKIMHFRKSLVTRTNYKFMFGDTDITHCDSYRYLRLELNESLDYSHSVDVLSSASGRALGALVSKYYAINGLHYNTYTKLYSNLVEPVMDYADAIWGYKSYNANNTVQHRAMRCFLGVGKYTAIPAMYGELCWKTHIMRHHLDMIRYFIRLVNMDQSRLTYKVFRWDYDKPRIGTWCHEIKTILNKHNIGHYYSIIPAPRGVNISAILTQQLCDEQKALWDTSRHMPKLSNYNKVKDLFSVPRYVFQHLTRQERSALAKLYCGNLPSRSRRVATETYHENRDFALPVMCWTMRFTSSSNVNDIPKIETLC